MTLRATSTVEKFQDDNTLVPVVVLPSLPPSGAAGGDLTGNYPNPEVNFISANGSQILQGKLLEFAAGLLLTRLDCAILFGLGAPSDVTLGKTHGLYFNISGTPGTALAPGTLIYQTSNSGVTWTAIL